MLLLLTLACAGPVDDLFFVAHDDAVLPVNVRGAVDSGTVLIYVQGGPGYPSIDMREVGFVDWETRLEPHVGVAYYDQRGTGNALGDYRIEDMTVDQWVGDLDAVTRAVRDRYTPERIVWLSHSWGGYLAALGLLDTDAPVDAWISVNGTVSYVDAYIHQRRRDFVARVAQERMDAGDSDPFWTDAQAWAQANPTVEDDAAVEALGDYLDGIWIRLGADEPALDTGPLLRAVFWSHYDALDSHLRPANVISVLWPQYDDTDLLPRMGTVEVPTLLINGSWDDIVPDEIAQDLADAIGPERATLVRIPQAGHTPFTEQPEPFGEATLSFVESL
ncbi:MAG: alpha/beta hydrolase [Alphaproteobacteria bacterium]|nr:alpha/beta hydrolase [Alphaproteobacteria bacterium]